MYRLAGMLVLFLGLIAVQVLVAQRGAVLRLAAAADLEPVLPEIIAAFEQQHGVKVEVSYASSATLATQILNGGPFDLFLAADLSFPERVVNAGLADTPQPIHYARGTLVLWTRNDSRFRNLSLESLRDPAVRSVAVANPEHAPYGRAAKAAIDHLGLASVLNGKLVVAENIAQTAQYVESGNAELGFLSLTSALSGQLKSAGHFVEVPRDAYPPIVQGAVVMKSSPQRELAHTLLGFLLSASTSEQLQKHGLQAP